MNKVKEAEHAAPHFPSPTHGLVEALGPGGSLCCVFHAVYGFAAYG